MGLFGKSFHKEKKFELHNYSVISTDVHSHLIPGLDDGSKSVEESVQMIKGLSELGYKKIIATPHVMSDFYKNSNQAILEGYENLKLALEREQVPVSLGVAAEYFVDFDFEEKVKAKDVLTFGNNFVLMELSYVSPPENLNALIFQMNVDGYKIILAHPERYTYWHNNMWQYEQLKDRDVYFQINILSLSGHYSPAARKVAQQLVDADMVNFVGTDIHNINAVEALKHTAGDKYLEKLVSSGKLMNSTI